MGGESPRGRQHDTRYASGHSDSDRGTITNSGRSSLQLKDFHTRTLSLGAMGLDPLREALARI